MKDPTPEELEYLARYTIDTIQGKVYLDNQELGTFDVSTGYIRIQTTLRTFRRSHVIWWAHHKEWPKTIVDHENQIKTDDRIDNLKASNSVLNQLNRDTYPKKADLPRGVFFDPSTSQTTPYKASFWNGKRNVFLGRFKDPVEAGAVADNARKARIVSEQEKLDVKLR